jgi:hypothetical protein
VARYAGKGLILTLENQNVGGAGPQLVRILIGALMNTYQLVRVVKWQGSQKDGVKDRENSDRAANPYHEGEDRGCRKPRRASQLAKCVSEIPKQAVHRRSSEYYFAFD